MAELDKRFIIELKNKEFVTYEGLLDLAHQLKLKSIKTEIVLLPSQDNNNQCIVKATATTEDGKEFQGYGDADKTNTNSMIRPHLIRMAETRAKARALRDLTNVGMTAIEELGEDIPEEPKQNITYQRAEGPPNQNGNEENICTDCGQAIAKGVATYSKHNFGKELCMSCQKKQK